LDKLIRLGTSYILLMSLAHCTHQLRMSLELLVLLGNQSPQDIVCKRQPQHLTMSP